MAALGISVLAGLPVIWRRGKAPADFAILAVGALAAGWFAWRTWISPVAELGQADLLLVATAVGAFVSIRAIANDVRAETTLIWGIALLLLANEVVIGFQLVDPSFTPLFHTRAAPWPSGFYAQYNEAANYLIASSMLVGAAAIFGRHAKVTRILWLLIALAGLAGVWFTRSRGGILGAAVGCGVLATMALAIGKRREARWFAPLLIAIPVIGLGVGAFLFQGWQEAQYLRQAGTGVEQLLDNDCRLYFLGIALSCVGLHPMSGGGARSFSWECFRFVDAKAQGDIITHKPDMVHNELVQSAADYGIVGAGLIVALLATFALAAILRVAFEERPAQPDSRDAWRLGALAALTGMLVQSCFSFVFHLMPGVLLLGICLGQMSRSDGRAPSPQTLATKVLLTLACFFSAALLLPAGWKGTQVTRILWPTHFSKQVLASDESRIEALSDAIRIWPQSGFHLERATIFQEIANQGENTAFKNPGESAIRDYQEAARLHPFDPSSLVNQANLLSQLNRDTEAEACFAKAIDLQGGMEPAFRSHFSLATHYLRKGIRIFDPQKPELAHDALEFAAEQIERAVKEMHWVIADMREPRLAIHESLGAARESVGDREGALAAYDFAATLPEGKRAHYRAGVLIGKKAVDAWMKRRPSEAFYHFMEARKRIEQSGGQLPAGVTPSQRLEYIAYLDERIAFFKRTKVEPSR